MDSQPDQETPKRGLLASTGDFLRWLLLLGLVTAAVAAVVMYFVNEHLDDEIRRYAEAKLQSHYPELRVTIESARRVPGKGFEIRGIWIRDPSQTEWDGQVAYIDELLVQCNTELGELVAGRVCAQQLLVRRGRLYMLRREDGTWNADALLPLPQFSDCPPPVVIEGGSVEIAVQGGDLTRPLQCHDVNVTINPLPTSVSGPAAAPSSPPQLRQVRAKLHSNLFEAAQLVGQCDLCSGNWSIQGSVAGLEISPEVLARLPTELRNSAEPLRPLRGHAQLQFRARNPSDKVSAIDYTLAGSFSGRIDDSRLPAPLTNVETTFQYDGHSLKIQEAAGQFGDAKLRLAGNLPNFGADGRFNIQASAQNLVLDKSLVPSLPEAWRETWDKFLPGGRVNVQLNLASDGQQTSHDLTVECLDVSFAYYKFPYRLEHTQGTIRFANDVLELVDLTSTADGRPVQIGGRLVHPGPDCLGWVEFSLQDPIPLDERLIVALRGEDQENRAHDVVRSLDPHGSVTLWGRFERQSLEPRVEHKRLEIGLQDCSINYKEFPYPLYRIGGTLSMTDDHWTLHDLEGFNDSGWVTCNGGWASHPEGGTLLTLDFNATDVPIEEELRNALKPEAQRLWNALRPRGTIDQLRIGVRYESRSKDLSVDVTAVKRPPTQNVEGRSITVKPDWMPYQWDHVVGRVSFRDGGARFENIRARHDETRLEFSGIAETLPDGRWRVHLTPFNMDRVNPNHELTNALPEKLGGAITKLNLTGLISMGGSVEFVGSPDRSRPPAAGWDLHVDLENGGIDCGFPLEHIHGGVTLQGQFDGMTAVSHGMLAADSLICKGVQLTNVSGPLYLQASQIWFGEWIPEDVQRGSPQPVTAAAWGGTLNGNAHAVMDQESRFDLAVTLSDGDLGAISREATRRHHELTGRAFGSVQLSGTSQGEHTLRGRGRVGLRDADIYELPVMIRVLKFLSVKPPDSTAFTSSDVDFRVEGDRIYFDRIDFDGDVISLDGRGEMNLERQIRLNFDTVVGRDGYLASPFRPVLKEFGRRLLVIQVSGSLDDPQVKKELVPELNETFQQMFPAPQRRQSMRPPNPLDLLQSVFPR